ncbi:hypothetical protein Hanom_Chr14g01246161 [Helianthus anomalus]
MIPVHKDHFITFITKAKKTCYFRVLITRKHFKFREGFLFYLPAISTSKSFYSYSNTFLEWFTIILRIIINKMIKFSSVHRTIGVFTNAIRFIKVVGGRIYITELKPREYNGFPLHNYVLKE